MIIEVPAEVCVSRYKNEQTKLYKRKQEVNERVYFSLITKGDVAVGCYVCKIYDDKCGFLFGLCCFLQLFCNFFLVIL